MSTASEQRHVDVPKRCSLVLLLLLGVCTACAREAERRPLPVAPAPTGSDGAAAEERELESLFIRQVCPVLEVPWGDGVLRAVCPESKYDVSLSYTDKRTGATERIAAPGNISFRFVDLDGLHPPELHVHYQGGKAEGSQQIFLSLGPNGLRLLLFADADILEEIADLDGDGRPEIAGLASGWLPVDGYYPGGHRFYLPLVIGRDPATGAYRDRSMDFRARIVKAMDEALEIESHNDPSCAFLGNLVEALANAQRVHLEQRVWSFVRTHCETEDFAGSLRSLKRNGGRLRSFVERMPCMIAPPPSRAHAAARVFLPSFPVDKMEMKCRPQYSDDGR